MSDHTCSVLVFLQSGDLPISQQPLAVPEKHPCCRCPYFCLLLRCPGAQSVSSSNLLLCLFRQIRNNKFCQINFASTLFFLNWYINKYQAALTAGQNFITVSNFMRSVWQTELNTDVKKELEVVPQFNFWLTLFSPPCLTGEIFFSTHWCVSSVQLIQLTGVSEQNTQKKEVFYDRVGPVLSFLHCFSRTVLCAGKPVWFHNSMTKSLSPYGNYNIAAK